jgi:hypothetical protein
MNLRNKGLNKIQNDIDYELFDRDHHSYLYDKIKGYFIDYFFPLMYYIFETEKDNINFDILCIIIENIQLLSIFFQQRVKYF